ncbi:MAG: class I SAM-dependent methyltransferase [Sulfuricaulis sp.]
MISRILNRLFRPRAVVYGAGFFGDQWFQEWQALKDVLSRLIRSEPRWRTILDFGCGPGVMIDLMNDRGYEYFGCDSSTEARALYIKHYGKYPDRYLARLEDAGDRHADLLLSFDVLEHMRDEEIENLLAKTKKIPEVLVNISRQRGIPGHINIKPDRQWIAFFKSRGFSFADARTRELRKIYETLRPGCPDLWNKNLFLFERAGQGPDGSPE